MFSTEDKQKIQHLISAAEKNTTGEIVIHLCRHVRGDVLKTAQRFFYHEKLMNTRDRNAVLIYIANNSKKFAILGDENIHKKLADEFWQKLAEDLKQYFKRGEYLPGMTHCIETLAEKLTQYFPGAGHNEFQNNVGED